MFLVLSVAVAGAHCELSRTIVMGDAPTEEQRRMFRAVSSAHEAARALARPGTPASDLDRAARRALAVEKLAEHLTMRTGHGLGTAPVEAPNLGAGDETPLQAGMVISIEPGVCVPGVLRFISAMGSGLSTGPSPMGRRFRASPAGAEA